MKKFNYAVLLSLAVVLCGCQSPKPVAKVDVEATEVASKFSTTMREEDFLKLRELQDKGMAEKKISDSDLDYVLNLFKTDYKGTDNQGYIHISAAATLTSLTEYEPGQKDRIYEAVAPLLDSSETLSVRAALVVVDSMKDERALGKVVQLIDSTDEKISKRAKLYVAAVGYQRDQQ